MNKIRVIEVKQSIFDDNNKKAEELRCNLRKNKTFLLNVMSSPGSGKTTTLVQVINYLKHSLKIAVMEADIDSDCDSQKIYDATGVKVVQLHTGGMCHLDSKLTKEGLESLPLENEDLVILENIGNLVCPAEFDTGSSKNLMIMSIPEGDDKPLKYPLMFEVCDICLINKIDTLSVFDFDIEKFKERVYKINPNMKIIEISAKFGTNIDKVCDLLVDEIRKWCY